MDFANSVTRKFIDDHLTDDVVSLLLHRPRIENLDFEYAITQISGKQKIKNKLPTFYSTPNVVFPLSLSLEQCSSELTANYKASLVSGNTLVDLTGGFGVDTLAFSKRFDRVVYVEKNATLCAIMKHNCNALNVANVEIVNDEAENVLDRLSQVDVIYIDPSRRGENGEKVSRLDKCTPDVLNLKNVLLRKAKKCVLVKISPLVDAKDTIKSLPEISEFWSVSVKNECKELLFAMNVQSKSSGPVKITAVELSQRFSSVPAFSFTFEEEKATELQYGEKIGKYLYEPNASLLNAGCFKRIAVHYGLEKLHKNSHLYTSNEIDFEFLGQIYEVEDVFSFNKKELKGKMPALTSYCLKVRNFPLSVDSLSKKLSLKNMGEGNKCLFATTLHPDKHILIAVSRVDKLVE